jgi:hypothetical protein
VTRAQFKLTPDFGPYSPGLLVAYDSVSLIEAAATAFVPNFTANQWVFFAAVVDCINSVGREPAFLLLSQSAASVDPGLCQWCTAKQLLVHLPEPARQLYVALHSRDAATVRVSQHGDSAVAKTLCRSVALLLAQTSLNLQSSWLIGQRFGAISAFPFGGSIDELRVFSQALSAAEINDLMTLPVAISADIMTTTITTMMTTPPTSLPSSPMHSVPHLAPSKMTTLSSATSTAAPSPSRLSTVTALSSLSTSISHGGGATINIIIVVVVVVVVCVAVLLLVVIVAVICFVRRRQRSLTTTTAATATEGIEYGYVRARVVGETLTHERGSNVEFEAQCSPLAVTKPIYGGLPRTTGDVCAQSQGNYAADPSLLRVSVSRRCRMCVC